MAFGSVTVQFQVTSGAFVKVAEADFHGVKRMAADELLPFKPFFQQFLLIQFRASKQIQVAGFHTNLVEPAICEELALRLKLSTFSNLASERKHSFAFKCGASGAGVIP